MGLAVAATLAAAAPARAAQEPPTITMSGAVPAAAVTADLAYFYRRSHRNAPRFDIVGGQTNTGIADAARGVSAVGLVTRALLPTDPPGLFFTPIARTGFCLVTHRTNPLPGITRALVQDLVAARVTSWAQVPGATRADAIVAATLPAGGGGRVSFETAFLDPATPQAYVPRSFTSSAQVRAFVLSTPSAWGYADLAFTNGLHTVPYEGIRVQPRDGRVAGLPGELGAGLRHPRQAEGRRAPLHPLGAVEREGAARDRDALRAGPLATF